MQAYFDHNATTPLDEGVLAACCRSSGKSMGTRPAGTISERVPAERWMGA
jgi:cysteine sulfinate desulfinase/cysteine desulfurase-like protein